MTTNNKLNLTLACLFSFFLTSVSAQITYSYTGAVQTYVVPAGVTLVNIEASGASGGTADNDIGSCPNNGGRGGYATGDLTVTPGETLYIYVGGEGFHGNVGGWNGAGTGCGTWATCAKGGGASDVRQGGIALANRIIVGGGGGGAEWSACNGTGGDGGGLNGDDGTESGASIRNGDGGTQVAGGIAGDGGFDGTAGTLGQGGDGGTHPAGHSGSGGGGYYGGGGSSEDGHGGGGSSYIAGLAGGSTTSGVRSGDGEVIITVLCNGLTYTATAEEICEGEEITLDATSIAGGTITWDMGVTDGVPFTPIGVGIITYTATSSEPDDCELEVDILVNPNPEVTIDVDDDEICEGEMVTFTQGGDADTYVWDPADVVDGVPYTPGAFGTITYTLTGTIDATGCESVATIDVTMHESPVVTADVDFSEICLGDEVIFTGGGATTYDWDMGVTDGVPFTPGGLGTVTYTVTGTDAVTGCTNTATVDVIVNDDPIVTATADETEVCDGEEVTLTGGGAVTYDWDLGVDDGVAFTPPLGTTTYTVVGSTPSGCEAIATIDITVSPLPVVIAAASEIVICLGEEVTFTGSGSDTYVWDLGVTDGVPYTPAGIGLVTYTVIGTDDVSGCEGTASIDVEVEAVPVVTATASETDICEGESVTLTGGGTDSYVWDMGATNGVPFTPGAPGTIDFTVTGTDATSGCENTAVVSVTVHEAPDVTASATTTEVCIGESLTITGSGADSYSWSGGIFDGVAFTPAETGTTIYTVTGTSEFGCVATATIEISVIDCEPVTPDFILPSPLCVGDCITIMDASTGGTVVSWDWDFGGAVDPATSTDQNPTICLTTQGTYFVQLTTTSATGATENVVKELVVNVNPLMTAAKDTIIDLGGEAILVAGTTSSGSFSWIPNDGVDCPTCQFTSANPKESTTYTVTLIDENGCSVVDTVMVLVNFIEGVGVPTAFSPNGDGNNDILFVKGYALEAISFTVYNRYGEQVFQTTQQGIGWDGTFKNRDENPGVFTWVLSYQYLNGKSGSQRGNTTLIR